MKRIENENGGVRKNGEERKIEIMKSMAGEISKKMNGINGENNGEIGWRNMK